MLLYIDLPLRNPFWCSWKILFSSNNCVILELIIDINSLYSIGVNVIGL